MTSSFHQIINSLLCKDIGSSTLLREAILSFVNYQCDVPGTSGTEQVRSLRASRPNDDDDNNNNNDDDDDDDDNDKRTISNQWIELKTKCKRRSNKEGRKKGERNILLQQRLS